MLVALGLVSAELVLVEEMICIQFFLSWSRGRTRLMASISVQQYGCHDVLETELVRGSACSSILRISRCHDLEEKKKKKKRTQVLICYEKQTRNRDKGKPSPGRKFFFALTNSLYMKTYPIHYTNFNV